VSTHGQVLFPRAHAQLCSLSSVTPTPRLASRPHMMLLTPHQRTTHMPGGPANPKPRAPAPSPVPQVSNPGMLTVSTGWPYSRCAMLQLHRTPGNIQQFRIRCARCQTTLAGKQQEGRGGAGLGWGGGGAGHSCSTLETVSPMRSVHSDAVRLFFVERRRP
jgi:hypothetical protein